MNMEITTTGRNDIAFTDKTLQNATMKIFQINEAIRKNYFAIAFIVAGVDSAEAYKADGFKDVHEWTSKTFGYKKSMSYDMLKIGREYTREMLNKSGKVAGYECNLLPADSSDNFRTSQVIKLLPLGREMAGELVERGEVTPDMTVRAIADVVKGYTTSDDEEPAETAEPEEPAEPQEVNEQVDMIERYTDDQLIAELVKRGYLVSKGEKIWGVEDGAAVQ